MSTVQVRIELVIWLLIVVTSSIAVIALTRAYDWNYLEAGADHPWFFPLTAGLTVIVGLAGWRVPRQWWVFALLAWLPTLAVSLGIGGDLTAEQRAFVGMTVFSSLLELLIFAASAFVGSRIRLGTSVPRW